MDYLSLIPKSKRDLTYGPLFNNIIKKDSLIKSTILICIIILSIKYLEIVEQKRMMFVVWKVVFNN